MGCNCGKKNKHARTKLMVGGKTTSQHAKVTPTNRGSVGHNSAYLKALSRVKNK